MPARNSAYLSFLNDPDQDSRRLELEAFFGPNAPIFLQTYDKLRADTVLTPNGRPRFSFFSGGLCAPAFFLGPIWFFYRKMWLVAWIIVAAMVALACLPLGTHTGLIAGILLAALARRTYVQFAIGKLQQLRSPDGILDLDLARHAGGVSRTAGAISGTIYALFVITVLVSVFYLASHGLNLH